MKLGLDSRSLLHHFEVWQRERNNEARRQFQEMLAENAFVEFWGRLGKLGGEGVDGGVKAEDVGEDEGEGGGGKVDMKALAKTVDVAVSEGAHLPGSSIDSNGIDGCRTWKGCYRHGLLVQRCLRDAEPPLFSE